MQNKKFDAETYKNNPEKIYDDIFWNNMERCRQWQPKVANKLFEMYKPNSVIDYGCGCGYYIEGFYNSGCKNVIGIEFMYEKMKQHIPQEIVKFIEYGDVTKSNTYGKFDFVMSVEVAEHILPEMSDSFVKNLVESSNKYIFLTAAIPGQGGDGHFNEQPKQYWIDKIEKNGFKYRQEETKNIINECNRIEIKRRRYFNVIMRNLMFFIKEKS